MNHHRMSLDPDDSLFFDAVAYVLEELSSSDRDTFERRLVEEQDAREAVAEAVRFCQTIRDACQTARGAITADTAPAAHVENFWRRPAIWGAAAVAIAASALAMVVMEVARKGAAHSTASAESEPGKQLAVAWANLPSPAEATDDLDAAQEITTDAFSLESEGTVNDSNAENDATESVEASPAVDWFLEALTASLSREPVNDISTSFRGCPAFFTAFLAAISDPEGVRFHSPGFTKQSTSLALKGRYSRWPVCNHAVYWNHALSGLAATVVTIPRAAPWAMESRPFRATAAFGPSYSARKQDDLLTLLADEASPC